MANSQQLINENTSHTTYMKKDQNPSTYERPQGMKPAPSPRVQGEAKHNKD